MFFATLSISKGGGPFLITQVKTTCSLHRRYSMESTNIWHIRNCMLFIFTCMKKTWLGLCFMEEKNICMQVESKAKICITFSTNLSVIVVTDTANIKHIFGGFLQLMGFDFNWVCRVPGTLLILIMNEIFLCIFYYVFWLVTCNFAFTCQSSIAYKGEGSFSFFLISFASAIKIYV